jgi:hypothetical protein
MHGVLRTRDDIDRFVRTLRYRQQRAWTDGGEEVIDRLLDASTITVERGARDSYEGAETPLPYWLSLLADPHRLARVSAVDIRLEELGRDELRLLRETLRGAGARVTLVP